MQACCTLPKLLLLVTAILYACFTCLQDDIPDQVPTEDSDAAPGWEVPLRDVKSVTSVHVDVHNDLLWTGWWAKWPLKDFENTT
jgi:hypothetical protein